MTGIDCTTASRIYDDERALTGQEQTVTVTVQIGQC
jgi:hypothetical protein